MSWCVKEQEVRGYNIKSLRSVKASTRFTRKAAQKLQNVRPSYQLRNIRSNAHWPPLQRIHLWVHHNQELEELGLTKNVS